MFSLRILQQSNYVIFFLNELFNSSAGPWSSHLHIMYSALLRLLKKLYFKFFRDFRFDSGFRDYSDQEPHLTRAIHAVQFVAQHVKNQDRYDKVRHVFTK